MGMGVAPDAGGHPGRVLSVYRRLGADLPFGDPRRWHGVAMEGYFWRFTHRASGRVVIALCGVNRATRDAAPWANVCLAAHPGGFQREADLPSAAADERGPGVQAGAALSAGERHLRVDLGDGARLDVELEDRRAMPLRPYGGLGPAHAVPGLSQYWSPHVLGATVRGRAELAGEVVDLDGAEVYAEKNWGAGGFPERWWWGQAQGFGEDVCVAFAGGEVRYGPAAIEATALVVRVGDEVVRFGTPVASPVRATLGEGTWELRARRPGWTAELRGTADPAGAHVLPVPLPAERRSFPGAHEHLAGHVELCLRRRGAVVFSGTSELAGLEVGDPSTAMRGITG